MNPASSHIRRDVMRREQYNNSSVQNLNSFLSDMQLNLEGQNAAVNANYLQLHNKGHEHIQPNTRLQAGSPNNVYKSSHIRLHDSFAHNTACPNPNYNHSLLNRSANVVEKPSIPSGNMSIGRMITRSNSHQGPSTALQTQRNASVLDASIISEQNTGKQQSTNAVANPIEKMRYFQGTIERVMRWNKIFKDVMCYYEVVAGVISIQEGTVRLQKVMLLRDNKGPILQVVYYTTSYIDIENFHIGQKLRCVGRMIGNNIMHALRIKTATEEDVHYLQRHCYICDHAISNTLRVKNY